MITTAVVGSINVDDVYLAERLPSDHEKIRSSHYHSGLGGAAANTATWLASEASQTVIILGRVGDDAHGLMCLEHLRRSGVQTQMVRVTAGVPTSRATCWSDRTTKRIMTWHPKDLPNEYRSLPGDPTAVDHVHLAGPSALAYFRIWNQWVKAGASCSVETSGATSSQLLEVADLAFINADELNRSFGLSPYDSWTRLVRVAPKEGATLVITNGGSEATSVNRTSRSTRQPVSLTEAPAQAQDRTGAGDAFDAGYLAAWLARSTAEAALARGHEFAARAISQMGGARI